MKTHHLNYVLSNSFLNWLRIAELSNWIVSAETADEDEDFESGDSDPALLLETVDFTMLAKLNFVMFWTLLIDKTKKVNFNLFKSSQEDIDGNIIRVMT